MSRTIPNNLSNTDVKTLIDEWIRKQRDRDILKSRLIDGLLYKEIADIYKLSEEAVKKIIYKGENTIFSHVKELKR